MSAIYELKTFNKYTGTNDFEYFDNESELVEAVNIEKESELDIHTSFEEVEKFLENDNMVHVSELTGEQKEEFLIDTINQHSNEERHFMVYNNMDAFTEHRKEILTEMIDYIDDFYELMGLMKDEHDFLETIDTEVYNERNTFVIEEISGFSEYIDRVNLLEIDWDTSLYDLSLFLG